MSNSSIVIGELRPLPDSTVFIDAGSGPEDRTTITPKVVAGPSLLKPNTSTGSR
ncbi:MAG: hypothetical protein ACT4QB_06210 [Gammaproteobacteria bacterium]